MKMIKTIEIAVLIAITVFPALSFSANGPYGAPDIGTFERTPNDVKAKYEADIAKLYSDNFINKPNILVTASFYTKPEGQTELIELSSRLSSLRNQYSRFIFIGRSGSGIMAFLEGAFSQTNESVPEISDLPFSYSLKTNPTAEQTTALREHLRANGLSPAEIANSTKPLLFFDFVYSGTGVERLLSEIYKWAKEEGLAQEVRSKMHFFGAYPAEVITEVRQAGLDHQMRREMGKAYTPPSSAELKAQAETLELPSKSFIERYVAKTFSFRLSSDFYAYAGTHTYNAQASYTPQKWLQPFDRDSILTFTDHAGEPAFIELYYLMKLGKKNATKMLSDGKCQAPLIK